MEAATARAARLGVVDAVAVSAVTGEGIGVVRGLLDPGATTVLLGASGTGKSTLINTLLGEERQKTGEVRASDGRGRHTTVTRELLTLPGGAFLIDTPGIRIAGLWDGTGERSPTSRSSRWVPLPGLRPQHRAGLRRSRGAAAGADRGVAQASGRTRVDRRPARRAGTGGMAQEDHAKSRAIDESGRGESNPHLWLGCGRFRAISRPFRTCLGFAGI